VCATCVRVTGRSHTHNAHPRQYTVQHTATTHCNNTLQHHATPCNTLHHCNNTLQHHATPYSTLYHTTCITQLTHPRLLSLACSLFHTHTRAGCNMRVHPRVLMSQQEASKGEMTYSFISTTSVMRRVTVCGSVRWSVCFRVSTQALVMSRPKTEKLWSNST